MVLLVFRYVAVSNPFGKHTHKHKHTAPKHCKEINHVKFHLIYFFPVFFFFLSLLFVFVGSESTDFTPNYIPHIIYINGEWANDCFCMGNFLSVNWRLRLCVPRQMVFIFPKATFIIHNSHQPVGISIQRHFQLERRIKFSMKFQLYGHFYY